MTPPPPILYKRLSFLLLFSCLLGMIYLLILESEGLQCLKGTDLWDNNNSLLKDMTVTNGILKQFCK